jgi:SHS2 domain-containing protein
VAGSLVVVKVTEIEHTADRAFRVRGRDLKELFTHAAEALLRIEGRRKSAAPTEERRVAIEGFDRESLLVNWLNEILYLGETRRETYPEVEIEEISDLQLRARLKAQPGGPRRRLVKAVTFHGLRVRETSQGLEAEVIVDV